MRVVQEFGFSTGTTPQQLTLNVPEAFKPLLCGLRGVNSFVWAIVDDSAPLVNRRFMLFEIDQELVTPGGAPITKDDFVGSFSQGANTFFLFRRDED